MINILLISSQKGHIYQYTPEKDDISILLKNEYNGSSIASYTLNFNPYYEDNSKEIRDGLLYNNKNILIGGDNRGHIHIWDFSKKEYLRRKKIIDNPIKSLLKCDKLNDYIYGDTNGNLGNIIMREDDIVTLWENKVFSKMVTKLYYKENYNIIIASSADGNVKGIDNRSPIYPIFSLPKHHDWVLDINSINNSENNIITCDKSLYIWEIRKMDNFNDALIKQSHKKLITSIQVDSHNIYTSSLDGNISLSHINDDIKPKIIRSVEQPIISLSLEEGSIAYNIGGEIIQQAYFLDPIIFNKTY